MRIRECIRILKGFSKLEEMDVPAVEEKYGIKKAIVFGLESIKKGCVG